MMRKFVAGTLGMLLATLTISGIGQAQGVTAVQGTIQAVDCRTSSLVLKAPDGTHVFPTAPNTPVFVNSAPVGFCTLQQYIGNSATVSIAPRGDQLVAERVDVYAAATPAPANPAPSVSSAPPWLGIVLGTIIVGGLVYLLVRGRDGSVQRYPYSGPYDQSQYGPYQNGSDYGPYSGPYQYGPYQYDPYQRGPYQYGPRPYGPYQNGPYYGPYPYGAYPNGPYYYGPYPYGPPRNCPQGTWCYRRDAGDSNR